MKLIDLFEESKFPSTRINGSRWDFDDEDIINWCNKNASEYLRNPTPIFRGDGYGHDAIYHTKDFQRASKNTLNYYTLWMDNNPKWAAYPKRSKSLICSTSLHTADGYSQRVFRVIPSNECKIGVVPSYDLWFAFEHLRNFFKNSGVINRSKNMDSMANALDTILRRIGGHEHEETAKNPLEHNWSEFKDALKGITMDLILDTVSENRGEWPVERLRMYTVLARRMQREGFDDLYDALDSLMDPQVNGFKVVNPGQVPTSANSEIWIGGGDALLIQEVDWRKDLFKELGLI